MNHLYVALVVLLILRYCLQIVSLVAELGGERTWIK